MTSNKKSFKTRRARSSHAIQTDSSGTKGFKILEMYSYIFVLSEERMLYISACSVENLCAKTTFVEICI